LQTRLVGDEQHSDDQDADPYFSHGPSIHPPSSLAGPPGWPYDRCDVKLFLLLTLVGAIAIAPFVMLHQPWAERLWRRVRLLAVIYALVILVSAIVSLVFRWDAIYG
jgi:hypothetical protein